VSVLGHHFAHRGVKYEMARMVSGDPRLQNLILLEQLFKGCENFPKLYSAPSLLEMTNAGECVP
jgi:hypothetical protein